MSKRETRTFVAANGLRSLVPAGTDASRAALMLGTALGCSIVIAASVTPGAALAANECGTPVTSGTTDTATCGPTTDYPSGIIYTDGSTNTLLVQLLGGVTVEDPTGIGVFAENSGGGAVVVDTTTGDVIKVYGNGIGAYTTGGQTVTINNAATISAGGTGLYAFGIGGGDADVNNTGSIYTNGADGAAHVMGIYGKAVLGSSAIISNSGAVTVNANNAYAAGLYASAPGAVAQITNTNNVTVTNTDYALGLGAVDADVALVNETGNVTVTSTDSAATGVISSGTSLAESYVYGNVSVTAYSTAKGAVAYADKSTGLSDVKVEGSVSAASTGADYEAFGVVSIAGVADVDVTGNITVSASNYANGVRAWAYGPTGDATVIVNGNVTAASTGAGAMGVYAFSENGNSTTIIGGNVSVTGDTYAGGVRSSAAILNTVVVSGGVSASTTDGYAYGVRIINGAANISVAGNVSAYSKYGNATGIRTVSGNNTVYVGGSVSAHGYDTATGLNLAGGNLSVDVAGDVSTVSTNGNANAIEANAYGGNIVVGGNVTASTVGGFGAAGVLAFTDSDTLVSIGGNVAVSSNNIALGVDVFSFGNITIDVAGSTTVSGYIGAGIWAVSPTGGTVNVDVGNVTFHQYASASFPIHGAAIDVATNGTAYITAGNVVTTGEDTDGVRVGYFFGSTGFEGDSTVTVASVSTMGNYSDGVLVNGLGNATVTVGNSYTKGAFSYDVFAYSKDGAVSITSGNAVAKGYYSTALQAVTENGPVLINSGYASTSGDKADAIVGISDGTSPDDTVAIYAGTTITHGNNSTAIFAEGPYAVSVTSAMIRTYGNESGGILALSENGPLTVTSGTVITHGEGSYGILASSLFGDVTVTSGNVFTYGDHAEGVYGESDTGNVTVNSTYVRTIGNYSVGVGGSSFDGDVTVNSNTVFTEGYQSIGVGAESHYGDVTVTSTYSNTSGNFAPAVAAKSYYGNVTVTSGAAITHGAYSDGVYAVSGNGTATVTSIYVHTSGYKSDGIYALGAKGVTVTSGTVKTEGYYADGIFAKSSGGNVSVTSTYVSTVGNQAAGIYAYSGAGNVTVSSGTVQTYSFLSPGIVAIAANGTAAVTTNYVHTQGYESDGVRAYGYYGATVTNTGLVRTDYAKSDGIDAYSVKGPVSVTSNAVVTYGADSVGIYAHGDTSDITVNSTDARTYGSEARAISAVTGAGNVSVTSGLAVTHGFYSDAIVGVSNFGGDVYINSGQVFTYGNYSQGIRAHAHEYGNATIVSGLVVTHGFDAVGIYALANQGTANVTSGAVVTYGAFADGIEALGEYGATVTSHSVYTYGAGAQGVYARSIYNGDVTINLTGNTIAREGVAVWAQSAGYATINNHGEIYGGELGVLARSAYGTTINNALGASIRGGSGYAIYAGGGSVTINNAGVIYGYATLDTSNNTVNNSGFWKAYGNSFFGYGTDVFNNTGTVMVAPLATAPVTVIWSGLDVFNNSGLVDLRNGHTGDIFMLNNSTGGGTAWNGTGNSTLAVDVDLGPSLSSDKLVVGAVSGKTTVEIADVDPGAPAVLNFTGTTVVQGTSGQASNFVMAPVEKGFVAYQLSFDSANTTWNIVGLPGQAAFELLKAPEMAQGFWRRSGDAWSAREQEVRDSIWGSTPPTRGEGWEMWAQAQIGGERLSDNHTFDVGGFAFTPNLGTDTDWRGFQMGADEWTSKNFLWGFTGGFLEQDTTFHLDHNSMDLTGWNFGVYAGLTRGTFFLNGLAKADWYDIRANMITVPAMETNSGNTYGLEGEAGWRLGSQHLYLEPRADIEWTTTHLDNANFATQLTTFTYGNADSARGSIGARVGGLWGSMMPYVGLYAVEEFEGENKMTMLTGAGCPDCMSLEDTRPGSYGKADFGITTTSWNGLEGFLKGETEFGGHTNGFTGRLGVRWRW